MNCRLLYIRLLDSCNARCVMCGVRKDPGTCMDFQAVGNLLNEACQHGVRQLILTGGEPLLYPRIEGVATQAYSLGLNLGIITNGLLLDQFSKVILPGLNVRITVSIDNFQKQHDVNRGVPGLWQKAVKGLARIKSERGNLVSLRLQMVVSTLNYKIIPDLVGEIHSKTNFDGLTLIPIKDYPQLYLREEEIMYYNKNIISLIDIIDELKIKLSTKLYIFGTSPDEISKSSRGYYPMSSPRCCISQYVAFVDGITGNVYPCNILPHRNEGRFILGNIYKNSFSTVWFSKHAATIRKRLSNKVGAPCHLCDPENDLINSLA